MRNYVILFLVVFANSFAQYKEVNLRLTAETYPTDIQKIRDAVRANGSLPKPLLINVSINGLNATLIMNQAYSPFACTQAPNASLYILGIKSTVQNHLFLIEPKPIPDLTVGSASLSFDGSYLSLGYASTLPQITTFSLENAVRNLSKYVADRQSVTTPDLKEALARIIVVVAEGTRFKRVEQEVTNLLRFGSSHDFTNLAPIIKNWNTTLLGDNNLQ